MSVQGEAQNLQLIIDALRRNGVDVPNAMPVSDQRRYWYVSNGSFSTVVDYRDAANVDEAIKVARCDPLQAWYANDHVLNSDTDVLQVKEFSYAQYVEWLKRGVR